MAGGDIFALSKLLDHASVEMTASKIPSLLFIEIGGDLRRVVDQNGKEEGFLY